MGSRESKLPTSKMETAVAVLPSTTPYNILTREAVQTDVSDDIPAPVGPNVIRPA